MFEDRAAIGYDHGCEDQKFYLRLALDPHYVEGSWRACLERIGEDEPEDEAFFRDLREEGERETRLEALKAECEVLPEGRGLPPLLTDL